MSKPQGAQAGEQSGRFSALREPVGSHDRGVYVRRRIIVLLGLVAVVAAIVLMIFRPGGSGGAADVEQVNVPTDLVEEPEKTPAGADTPACDASQLLVTAMTDQQSYGAGEEPQLSLSVENTGEAACIADLGTTGMSFTVASGDDEVWRSTDCQANAASTAVILDPKTPLESEAISWDRTRSSTETCSIDRDPVVAGGASYHLRATVGGVASLETAQFLLY